MNLNSLLFLFYFLPIFLIALKMVPRNYRFLVLLIFSAIFYAYNSVVNLLLILVVGFVNFFLVKINAKKKSNIIFVVNIVINIVTLALFKYNDNIALPLGISFYTFNNLSYIIDVKRGNTEPENNLLCFYTYELMFPTISMGPLNRYKSIKEDLLNLDITINSLCFGIKRFIWGFIKKSVVADNLAILYKSIMEINKPTSLLYWLALLVFGLQLYIDFSSYSDMAIGLGKTIGINYQENFDHPYLEESISAFWRKWHMSLTNFFKEYVYIPLGGNRVSVLRNIINILIVWILTGIWHGSKMNYLIWGLYYGIIIVLEKFVFKRILDKLPKVLKHIYVIFLLMIGYVFFSIEDLGSIIPFIKVLFSKTLIDNNFMLIIKENYFLIIVGIILCFRKPKLLDRIEENKVYAIVYNVFLVLLFVLAISYILSGNYMPSLYSGF